MSILVNHGLIIGGSFQVLAVNKKNEFTNGNLALTGYPSVQARAGDLFIVHCATRTSSLQPTSIGGGWTTQSSDVDSGNFWRQGVFYIVATGSEVPNSTFSVTVAGLPTITATKCTSCYLIRGASTTVPVDESGGLTNGNGTQTHSGITNTNKGSLAICFYSSVQSAETPVMTGATGGTWIKPFSHNTRTDSFSLSINMQYAYLPDIGISGGSTTGAGLNMNRAFAIKPN